MTADPRTTDGGGGHLGVAHNLELGPPARALYTSGRCRCPQCGELDRSYRQTRNRDTAYGTWSPYVLAEPVREHLALLRHGGASLAEIAASADLPESAIASIIYPSRSTGAYSTKVRRATADALLTVRPVGLSPAQVNCSATARRLQVLVGLGWPYAVLAQRSGIPADSLWQCARGRGRVQASTATAVRTLSEQIGGAAPQPGLDASATAISRARTAARKCGWLPAGRSGK